ncbi:dihydrolipoyl dehydrogenase [Rhodococcus opacus PD630]|uniref:dihydrolipoyl dehydrogenase n=1 Tax=Rhodococcus opacus TaxID=37919 RepID=UPI00029CADCE|nr:dihydrolipoyl dehydrogenase [Rhodococcus opacus]EHI43631.1 dihydrolipoyl dehydrogenase [Rhodococcus opacus PD630]UDH01244.1 dihydrolipoyl dehydrogenase [Rhodococcus opacus PD630]
MSAPVDTPRDRRNQHATSGEDHNVDLVVLGGGSAGYACALRAAQLGSSVVLIEAGKLGGTCLHNGCIPTKALLHAAEVADSVRESAVFGVDATLHGIDMAGVNGYKNDVVAKLHRGLQSLIDSRKIRVVNGVGRFVGNKTVEVGGTRYIGKAVVLATGSRAKSLPGLTLGGRVITSDEALSLDTAPARVVVLGGGVIGVEFASIWASFGSSVTIVEALPRIVPSEDEWSSKQLERALRKRGVAIRTGENFAGVAEACDAVVVSLGGGETIEADLLLVAVGRGPRTEGFAEAGIAMDGDFVSTNEALETSHRDVYAVGDIVRGLQLAHRGFQQGIHVAERLAGLDVIPFDESGIPRVTYSNPEVASVGLTEQQAVEQFGEISSVVYDLAGNGKSQILRTSGGIKVVREGKGDLAGPIVGIHMVGARVGELIGEAQLIYNWGALANEVAQLVHAHPTQSEALGEAHLVLAGSPLHVHG